MTVRKQQRRKPPVNTEITYNDLTEDEIEALLAELDLEEETQGN